MEKGNGAIFTFIYRLLHASVFSSAMILYFSDLYGVDGVTWKHFTILFLAVALFFCVSKLQKRQRIYAIVLIVMSVVLVSFVMGKEKPDAWMSAKSSYLGTFVLAMFVCLLQLLFEKYFPLKAVFCVILCGMLLYSLFAGRYVPKMGVLFLLLYVVMTLTEYIWLKNRNKEKGNSHAYIVWLAPFFVLYFAVLCLMPMPKTPYSWQWLKDIYLRVEEKITIYAENFVSRNDEDLDGAISGFSESAALFSNLAANDKNIMVIETLPGKKQPLYLAGKIYDVFDGQEWKSTKEKDARERLIDTAETVYALEAYAKDDLDHPLYNGIRAKSGYRHFHTNYLLAPSKTWKIEGRLQYQQDGANLTFDQKAGYGTEYTLQYCRMNMGRETTQDFLQSNSVENPDLWESTVKAYAEENITYAQLLAYRENMRERYLPETTISPETEDWLAEVTKDAENEIDGLFCIEEALADMEYNVNPGGLPGEVTDEQSFLHYFLLDKQEGFCTYYATAFVLLARAEGFPARYVQGFCVPLGNAKETEVYSAMAHAWPEVYFEGKGWIPFEPTPGYGIRRYPAEPQKEGKKEENAVKRKELAAEKDVLDDSELSDDEEEEERKERDKKVQEVKRAAAWITICGLLILAVGMLLFVIDRLSEKYREKRRSTAEKYKRAVLLNMQILSMLGFERERSETYHELIERIEKGEDGEAIPTAFIAAYENILYGTREIGERELDECLAQREGLMQILRKKKGRRYVFYWLRLSVM